MIRRRFENRHASNTAERRIYGVHPIVAWLDTSPAQVRRLFYDPAAGERSAAVVARAKECGVALQTESRDRLSELSGTPHHQGLVAACASFPFRDLDWLIAAPRSLVVVIDHVQDPHNFGAILRSAEAAGAGAVVVPQDRAAPVSATVEFAAAGAAALLPIVRVVNLARALDSVKKQSYWVAVLVPRAGTNLFEFTAPRPLALVVGGEVGVHSLIERKSDFLVTIPMWGRSESLNASVAAGVALFEVRRRWQES